MAKFVFKIPEIERSIPSIQKASKKVKANDKQVSQTYDGLIGENFEGQAAQAVSDTASLWSSEMNTFMSLLEQFYGYMSNDILPEAKQANEQALNLITCFGGGSFGFGGADIVTLEPDAKGDAISSCDNIVDAYDEALVALSDIDRGLSELHNPFTPNPSIAKITSEIQENTEKFTSFKSALNTYASTVQSLDAMANGLLNSFSYHSDWDQKTVNAFLDSGFKEYIDAVKENADNMKKDGIFTLVCGVAGAVASIILIGVSGGTATPFVMAMMLGSTAYNLSNATEGLNKIMLASEGRTNEKAYNPLRDTLFMGNDTVYHLTGTALSLAAPYASGAQMAINASNRAFSSSVQAINMYNVKYMASLGASISGSYVSKQVALSAGVDEYTAEWISLGFGVVAGGATAAGMQKLDTTYNLSGYYRNPTAPIKNTTTSTSNSDKANGLDYLDSQLGSMKNNVKINKYESAESVNNWWKVEKGYENPPYTSKTIVQDLELVSDTKFVRVYDNEVSSLKGGWLMKADDIKGLNPKQIQEKFALPSEPIYIGEVTLQKGSNLRMGEVAENFGYKGGGTQFDLKGQYIGEYKEIGKIIDWSK